MKWDESLAQTRRSLSHWSKNTWCQATLLMLTKATGMQLRPSQGANILKRNPSIEHGFPEAKDILSLTVVDSLRPYPPCTPAPRPSAHASAGKL